MTCRVTDLQDLVYGFLDDEDERRVRTHLDGCVRCRADFERLDGEKDVLSRAASTPLPATVRMRSRAVAAVPLAFAAALLLSLLGMLLVREPVPVSDPAAVTFVPAAPQKAPKQDKKEKSVEPPVKKVPKVPPVNKGPKPPKVKPPLPPKHPKLPPVKKGPKPPAPPKVKPPFPPKHPKVPPVKKPTKEAPDKGISLKLKRLYLELKRAKNDPVERARIEDEIARLKAMLGSANPKKKASKKDPRAKLQDDLNAVYRKLKEATSPKEKAGFAAEAAKIQDELRKLDAGKPGPVKKTPKKGNAPK